MTTNPINQQGASKFIPWVILILMENGLWEFFNTMVTPLTVPKELEVHNQKDVKYRSIILDTVKDHLIPHLSEKTLAREMFEALKNIF
jgi:hypothetical protein